MLLVGRMECGALFNGRQKLLIKIESEIRILNWESKDCCNFYNIKTILYLKLNLFQN